MAFSPCWFLACSCISLTAASLATKYFLCVSLSLLVFFFFLKTSVIFYWSPPKWLHLNLVTSVRYLIPDKVRLLGFGCKDSKNSFEDTVRHITVNIAAFQLPIFPKCQIYSPNPNISQGFTLFSINSKFQILLKYLLNKLWMRLFLCILEQNSYSCAPLWTRKQAIRFQSAVLIHT